MEEFWIIFGGCGAKGRLNDIYAFNFETNVWICIDPGYQVSLHYYLQGIQYGFGAFYEKKLILILMSGNLFLHYYDEKMVNKAFQNVPNPY